MLVATAVVCAGIASAIGIVIHRWLSPVAVRARPADPVLTARFENTAGGYRFRYPFGWHLSQNGPIAEVTSPRGDAVVSFGVGRVSGVDRAASLSASLNRVVNLVGRSYSDVELTNITSRRIGGNPAVVREGLATNDAGGLVRFSLVVVQDPVRNFVIVTFEPARLVSVDVHSKLTAIVESFGPLAKPGG
jgi:hypothetical protein